MQSFSIAKKREKLPHRLFLVGPNRAGLDLQYLAEKFGITHCFKQIDGDISSHDELIPIYNAADLYVLPSFTEGFSLTLAEAMACGLPVITSSGSSLGEVANGYGYTLDKPDDIEALTHAITEILTDNDLKSNLRQKSLERAGSLHWRTTAKNTLDVLRELHDRQ
jgi:glycosyltransferase involved in cell wall biosynthesis